MRIIWLVCGLVMVVGCGVQPSTTQPAIDPGVLLQKSTEAVADAQAAMVATQGQLAVLRGQLADTERQLSAEKEVLSTRPADKQAEVASAALAKAASDAQVKIDKGTKLISDLEAAVAPVQAVLTQIQNNQGTAVPSSTFAPLSALGPYGTLAAILIPVGLSIFQSVQKSNLQKKLAGAEPILEHLTDITGEDNPVSALNSITAQASAAGVNLNAPPKMAHRNFDGGWSVPSTTILEDIKAIKEKSREAALASYAPTLQYDHGELETSRRFNVHGIGQGLKIPPLGAAHPLKSPDVASASAKEDRMAEDYCRSINDHLESIDLQLTKLGSCMFSNSASDSPESDVPTPIKEEIRKVTIQFDGDFSKLHHKLVEIEARMMGIGIKTTSSDQVTPDPVKDVVPPHMPIPAPPGNEAI